jgi:predicted regulator of Ras-like GTPase activity (Roadblock/LC7/MglB family)
MPYRLFGALHAAAYSTASRLRSERGQGTVEYVALILLLAFVFAAVVKVANGEDFDIGKTIVDKLKGSVEGVGEPPKAGAK